jgi:hypothetical protein
MMTLLAPHLSPPVASVAPLVVGMWEANAIVSVEVSGVFLLNF